MHVAVSFITNLLFGIILPTGDTGSDIYLMHEAMNFKLGSQNTMAGCRACYGKSKEEVYTDVVGECTVCANSLCGELSAPIDKLLEPLESECSHDDDSPSYFGWSVGQDVVEKRKCDSSVFCCIRVTPYENITNVTVPGFRKTLQCNDDVCKTHLNSLSTFSTIENLTMWRNSNPYSYRGQRYGGQSCEIVHTLGILISLPILMYFVKCIHIFYHDWRSSTASIFEIPFVVIQLYPQLRVIKYWAKYFRYGKLDQLEKDKAAHEREVETIEPYMESLPQVG